MAEFGANLIGDAELLAKFRALPDDVHDKHLRAALVKGARIVRDEMKRRAPKDSGELARLIRTSSRRVATDLVTEIGLVTTRERVRGGEVRVQVGPDQRAFWARFIELGFNLTTRGKKGSRRVVRHVPAQPFLRPAWEATREQAIDAIAAAIAAAVEQEATR